MKAFDVINGLRKRHGRNGVQWAFFDELRAGTGYTPWRDKIKGKPNLEQRMDAWAINLYPSKGFLRICYEIKVSRSDFIHEMKHPEKRQQGLSLSNQFYFATPVGLVRAEEIPPECGLIEIDAEGNSKIIIKALMRECVEPPMSLFLSLARRAAEMEERARGIDEILRKARNEGRLKYDGEVG